MRFPVPPCTDRTTVAWPVNNPFANRTSIVMCMEIGVLYPWLAAKSMVGNGIVDKINAKYKTNIPVEWKYYNTSELGFFTTMKKAVDNCECDVISSNTTPTEERKPLVHFQCSYGSTSMVSFVIFQMFTKLIIGISKIFS